MAGCAFNLVVIQFDAVIETVGPVRRLEVGVLMGKPRIGHGDRVIVLQIGSDMLDGDIVGDPAIMAFPATEQIIGAVDTQVQCGVITGAPAIGPENRHVDPHGAVMTRQAQQADGTGRLDLIIEGIAVIQTVAVGSGSVPVKAGYAAKLRAVGAFPVGRYMAIDTRGTIIGKGQSRHRHNSGTFVEAGEVMFAAKDRTCQGGGYPQHGRYNNHWQPYAFFKRVFHV